MRVSHVFPSTQVAQPVPDESSFLLQPRAIYHSSITSTGAGTTTTTHHQDTPPPRSISFDIPRRQGKSVYYGSSNIYNTSNTSSQPRISNISSITVLGAGSKSMRI